MVRAAYVIDPRDPRAPPQEVWEGMSEEERRALLARLPSDLPRAGPPRESVREVALPARVALVPPEPLPEARIAETPRRSLLRLLVPLGLFKLGSAARVLVVLLEDAPVRMASGLRTCGMQFE